MGGTGQYYLGTSGWVYAHWKGRFYPETLPQKEYLRYYSQAFRTTEINASFYHLPRPQTFTRWAEQVPEGFRFAVKASRLITHVRRLHNVEEPWDRFLHHACHLGSKLGPVLLQFPPGFKQDLSRLESLFQQTMHLRGACELSSLQLVCEFRHTSWFTEPVYTLLKTYGVALCIADSPRYPREEVITAPFTYFRYHGREQLFASSYSDQELEREAAKIRRYLQEGLTVYIYFNNDAQGYALANARTLERFLSAPTL
ncbi:MAG: DUF72 domain-containing protein [Nitrospinota bacterium]|nr:MAG: DUF72 domain-containing protein [Nitrospinota bacterium]